MLVIDRDPEIHRIVEGLPWLPALRERTGLPELEVYRHPETERFVLILLSHDSRGLIELGPVCEEDPTSYELDRDRLDYWVRTLKQNWRTVADRRRELNEVSRDHGRRMEAAGEQLNEAREAMATYLQRKRGHHVADKYRRWSGLAVLDRKKHPDVVVGT